VPSGSRGWFQRYSVVELGVGSRYSGVGSWAGYLKLPVRPGVHDASALKGGRTVCSQAAAKLHTISIDSSAAGGSQNVIAGMPLVLWRRV
jgi:hypothetical protein